MSGEALYERYKDALKRGHVAALRGKIDEALAAYAEAARIAPERSTPLAASGTALLRRRRPGDALRYYELALRVSPRDEAALLGRAQALAALDRRADAADAFDQVAELRAAGGKLGDAVDAARRGLELAEGRVRRRTLERLIERLRASEPGEPGRLALERALRVLDGPAVPRQAPVAVTGAAAENLEQAAMIAALNEADIDEGQAGEGEGQADVVVPEPVESAPGREGEPEPGPMTQPDPEAEAAPLVVSTAEPGPEDGPPQPGQEPPIEPGGGFMATVGDGRPDPEAGPARAPVAGVPSALDRAVPAGVPTEQLAIDAEMTLDSGDPSAPSRFLDLAAIHAREGRVNAAVDACYQALSLDPDDVEIHLALVELYDRQGWTALGTEKLALLERLVGLGSNPDEIDRVRVVRAGRG